MVPRFISPCVISAEHSGYFVSDADENPINKATTCNGGIIGICAPIFTPMLQTRVLIPTRPGALIIAAGDIKHTYREGWMRHKGRGKNELSQLAFRTGI